MTAYDRNAGRARDLLDKAGDRVTRVAESPTDAVTGADLVITTITVPLDPEAGLRQYRPQCASAPGGLRRRHGAQGFRASIYCVDDLGQYNSVADELYFFGLPKPNTHLAAVVASEVDVPTTGRRMFLNMGIAMDDVA